MGWLISFPSKVCSTIYTTASQGVQYALDCGRSVKDYASKAFNNLPFVSTCQGMRQKVAKIYDQPTEVLAGKIENSLKGASLKKFIEEPASPSKIENIEMFLDIFLGKMPLKKRIIEKLTKTNPNPSTLDPQKQQKIVNQLDPLLTEENAQKMGVVLLSTFAKLVKGIKETEEALSVSPTRLDKKEVQNLLFSKLVGTGDYEKFKKSALKKIEKLIDRVKDKILDESDRNAFIKVLMQILAAFIAFFTKVSTPRLFDSSYEFLSKKLENAERDGLAFNLFQFKGVDLINIDISKEDVTALKKKMNAYREVLFYFFANEVLSGIDAFDQIKAGDLDATWQTFTKELQPALSGTLQATADRLTFISKMTLNSASWAAGISYTEDPGKILQKVEPSKLVTPLIKGVKAAIRN